MANEWQKQDGESAFWKPEHSGEEIIGEIVSKGDGQFGTEYTLKQEDGTVIKTPGHKVLLMRMANAKIGDEVKIVFTGFEPPKQKGWKQTYLYDVFIKKN